MLRHAYLIMAYGQFEQLNYLLRMLDDPLNTIFVHIDKKSSKVNPDSLKNGVVHADVNVYQEIKVYWGHYSQTQCELFLLEKALQTQCDYYHLLSGEDLPLKNQKEIHDFFEKNKGKEFVRFWAPNFPTTSIEWISHYHPLQKYLRISQYNWINNCVNHCDLLLQKLQRLFKINRIRGKENYFQKGATWFSITKGFAEEILKRRKWIESTFKSTRSSDEIFVQSILKNSKFFSNRFEMQYEIDGLTGTRYIDWTRGKPYIFTVDDFDELINCGFLFARKFNYKKDSEIILRLYNYVTS